MAGSVPGRAGLPVHPVPQPAAAGRPSDSTVKASDPRAAMFRDETAMLCYLSISPLRMHASCRRVRISDRRPI